MTIILEKDAVAVIEDVKTALLPHVTEKKVFIVAYSVGETLTKIKLIIALN